MVALSPIVYILVAEVFVSLVRTFSIGGIRLLQERIKVSQYADHTTVIVSKDSDFTEIGAV